MTENFIVTGTRGYLGSNLVSNPKFAGKVMEIQGDLSMKVDPKVFEKISKPIIIHLAAGRYRDCYSNPEKGYRDTTVTTLNVMELARALNAKKVLVASSAAVYGNADVIPTPETALPKPISNYGFYKCVNERILEYYSDNYGIPTIAMRFMSITGGNPMSGIVPRLISTIRKNSSKLEIQGDGTQKRSYIYIDDIIDAIAHLAKLKTGGFNAFNIGSEDYVELLQVIRMVEEATGTKPQHKFLEMDKQDIYFNFLDIKKIKDSGWSPKHNSKEAIGLSIKNFISGEGRQKTY